MKFDSKVKGGLAWAGLFVILAVPSADLLFGKDKGPNANLAITSDAAQVKPVVPAAKPAGKVDPVETASTTVPAAKSADPVDTYLNTGKKLPAYISDANATPAVKPAAPALTLPVKQPVEVASVNPVQETPPVPLPRNARPVAKVASVPVTPAPAEQPLIIDETDLAQRQANLNATDNQPVEPFPMSDGSDQASAGDTVVTGDQLEEWDSGSLADYLAAKGLLSEDAAQPQTSEDNSDFVFNQGPSKPRKPQSDFFLF
jgi:hypothetical protein